MKPVFKRLKQKFTESFQVPRRKGVCSGAERETQGRVVFDLSSVCGPFSVLVAIL